MIIKRIFDCIFYQNEFYPQEKSLGHNINGQWSYFSTKDIIDMALSACGGLIDLGVQAGDKIGLVAYKNRPEWLIMDIAIQMAGAISIPVYPTISPREYEYIFNDAQIKYCFSDGGDLYKKVKSVQPLTPSLLEVYSFDEEEKTPFWENIFDPSKSEAILERKNKISPQDVATIIYTSGTTGDPKGVVLTHNNIVSNILAVKDILPTQPGDKVLSFLPLCHIFERTASYAYTYSGLSVTFTGTDNLGGPSGDLLAIQPHFFTTVPRLLEKVYEKIYNKGLSLTGIVKKIFFSALAFTDTYEYDKSYSGWDTVKFWLFDKLVFSKWRAALGGQVKGILTGAAPCPEKMARVFSAAGIPVREGYGLTETSPGITIGRFEKGGALLGTVGLPLEKIEILIDESEGDYRPGEGEILTDGPNIMKEYYNKPDKTAEVFKEIEGKKWFCTGDVGKLVKGPGGKPFLKITDRKKELLKTSGGKYVAPAPIESAFKEHFLIEQIMVVGDQKKFVSALILPAEHALKDWCDNNNIGWTSLEEVIKNPKVTDLYQKIADETNPAFSHIEQIKKFALIANPWEVEKNDGTEAELTPTMKLKRRVILKKCQPLIDKMYK